ncbi:MAG: hypothetical protein ACPG2Y_02195, partial [Acholeplasmataceae bacterium]
KSVDDFIKRRDRLILGGSTITHKLDFLTLQLKNLHKIKNLTAARLPLTTNELLTYKKMQTDVLQGLLYQHQSLSDFCILFFFDEIL